MISSHADTSSSAPRARPVGERGERLRARVGALAAAARRLGADEARDLGDDKEEDALPLADPAHPVRRLRVVAERHVLRERERGARRRRLRHVDPRRVHLVVEREAALGRQPAALEVHRRAVAQQDPLVAALLEVDDALELGAEERQQERRDGAVREAGDERAGVDERVDGRAQRGDRLEERRRRPAVVDGVVRDDGGVGERAEHLGVVALLVGALAHLERQQRRRRAREGDPPREEHLAAELLAVGRQLRRLVRRHLGEDEVLEVVADDERRVAQHPVEHPQVVGVAHVEEVERQDVEEADVRLAEPLGAQRRHRALVLRRLRPAHALPRRLHPADPHERRRPLELGAELALEARAQLLQRRLEVGGPQPLVPVRERRQPDGDVGVGVLGGVRRRVLADERDGEQPARARHVGGAAERGERRHLRGLQQAVRDAVHLLEDVGEQVVEPVGAEVERLHVRVGELVLHRRVLRRARRSSSLQRSARR